MLHKIRGSRVSNMHIYINGSMKMFNIAKKKSFCPQFTMHDGEKTDDDDHGSLKRPVFREPGENAYIRCY